MAPTLRNGFRKFRLIVLALASVLSLIWSVIITVYMAKNWSSYNAAQRGFFFGLIAVDFIGGILLYLMVVVQYKFWPDAARTVVLLGLHVAGSVVFTMHSSSFPCSAFGSTANCHIMTMIVIVGSWVISALMAMYAICLPVMALIPRPPSAAQVDDLENRPDTTQVTEDTHKSHLSSASSAWLLKNPEGMSPEVHASELHIPPGMPGARRTYSDASSLSSLPVQHQVDDNHIKLEVASVPSLYADLASRAGVATTHAPGSVERLNSSGSSSSRQYPLRSTSLRPSPLPNRFVSEPLDANRVSVASSSYASTYEYPMATPTIAEAPHRTPSMTTDSASVYSQSTARAEHTYASTSANASRTSQSDPSTSVPDVPGRLSVHSMMASVHGHAEPQSTGADYGTTSNGLLSPPLPTPRFSAGASQTSFDIQLSDLPKRESEDKVDFPTLRGPVRPSTPIRPSTRTDSTSTVDLDEWKRLVLTAAGRGQ
ncbi:hypothetical protein M405DRAFT_4993 [Rhizopogon salebrosus TDB-379]|nr:hypothetical protein M405DRAFT_4993 [Rhizopogon salebrosus TDB-379]